VLRQYRVEKLRQSLTYDYDLKKLHLNRIHLQLIWVYTIENDYLRLITIKYD